MAPLSWLSYKPYLESFTIFSNINKIPPYPIREEVVLEWIALRYYGSNLPLQGKLRGSTLASAISALKKFAVIQGRSTSSLSTERIAAVITGAKRGDPKTKKKAEPLSLSQLEAITSRAPAEGTSLNPQELESLHIDTAFKLAFAGLLRTKEVTYEAKDLADRPNFIRNKLLRRDVTFADNDSYVIINLNDTKTDLLNEGVEIILARTDSPTCPVTALRRLFDLDPQASATSPLLRGYADMPFTRAHYIKALRDRLTRASEAICGTICGAFFQPPTSDSHSKLMEVGAQADWTIELS